MIQDRSQASQAYRVLDTLESIMTFGSQNMQTGASVPKNKSGFVLQVTVKCILFKYRFLIRWFYRYGSREF